MEQTAQELVKYIALSKRVITGNPSDPDILVPTKVSFYDTNPKHFTGTKEWAYLCFSASEDNTGMVSEAILLLLTRFKKLCLSEVEVKLREQGTPLFLFAESSPDQMCKIDGTPAEYRLAFSTKPTRMEAMLDAEIATWDDDDNISRLTRTGIKKLTSPESEARKIFENTKELDEEYEIFNAPVFRALQTLVESDDMIKQQWKNCTVLYTHGPVYLVPPKLKEFMEGRERIISTQEKTEHQDIPTINPETKNNGQRKTLARARPRFRKPKKPIEASSIKEDTIPRTDGVL